MDLVLHDVALSEGGEKTIAIAREKIAAIVGYIDSSAAARIHLDGCFAYPGLINSHDHLDFNFFPRLGNKIYDNYLDWGADIHSLDKSLIKSVLKIPKMLRTQWGIYKNLLAGVTTVVQHGERLLVRDPLIDVFTHCCSLHSVRLEKRWKWKLNYPLAKKEPVVIHIGEGTDDEAHEEINQLIRWNLRKRRLVGIHGVAMNAAQAAHFEALVWCPDSNFFLLGATAAIRELKAATTILLGTDSTVSADWNIWNHLRTARATHLLSDEELIQSVTTAPAKVWKLHQKGSIKEGLDADIIVAKNHDYPTATDLFFVTNPADLLLVISKGDIVLFDESLLFQLSNISAKGYSRIAIAGAGKFVKGDIAGLIKQIRQFYPEAEFPIEIA